MTSSIDFDVDDYLCDASTNELIAELISRQKSDHYRKSEPNILREVYEAICDGDVEFARTMLGILLSGREPPNRKKQLAEIREGKHPFLRARQ